MTSGSRSFLNYSPAAGTRVVKPRHLVSRLISAYIAYMLVMGVICLIVPRFVPVFASFGVHLPRPTHALIQISDLCIRYLVWLWCIPVPGMWASVNVSIADKYRRRRMRLVAFVFVLSFLIFTIVALFAPLIQNHLLWGGTKI